MTIRLAVRVFLDGIKEREDRISLDTELLEDIVRKLAEEHAEMMASRRGMIEIEFLDELNPEQRFFRLGTDPAGMVMPVEVDLTKPDDIEPEVIPGQAFPDKRLASVVSRWGKTRPH